MRRRWLIRRFTARRDGRAHGAGERGAMTANSDVTDWTHALADAEARRRRLLRRLVVVAVCAGVFFAVSIAGTRLAGWPAGFAIFAGVAALAAAVAAFAPLSKLASRVRDAAAHAVAADAGAEYVRDPGDAPAAFDRFRAYRLIPGYDRAGFEDRIAGKRAGCAFEICEAHLEERRVTRDSKGRTRTRWVTVFRGQLCRIAYPRPFEGVVVVARDRGIFNALSRPGGRALQRVGLASPAFERAFETWGTDQVAARTLLDPVTIERFLELERLFEGNGLAAAFEAGFLHLAIRTGDRFRAPNPLAPFDADRIAGPLRAELDAIFDLVDAAAAPVEGRLDGAFSVADVRGRPA